MSIDAEKLCALVSSRICHDVINPLGAIGNGLELLSLGGDLSGPEIDLIDASHKNAEARVKFLRHAFGETGIGATINGQDYEKTAQNYCATSNIKARLKLANSLPRPEVKRTYLAIMCMMQTLSFGGDIHVSQSNSGWKIVGNAERRRNIKDLWTALLINDFSTLEIEASNIQFVLLSLELSKAHKIPMLQESETSITVEF